MDLIARPLLRPDFKHARSADGAVSTEPGLDRSRARVFFKRVLISAPIQPCRPRLPSAEPVYSSPGMTVSKLTQPANDISVKSKRFT